MELAISIITALVSFVLVLFVFVKNRLSATHIYFSSLIFSISLYPIFNYMSLHSISSDQAFFWAKFILLSAIPAGPLFLFFVIAFPGKKFLIKKKLQIAICLWALANIVFAFTGLIFESVRIVNGGPQIEPGPAIASFGLLQVSNIVGGSYLLIRKYLKARGFLKLQLRYITYGILISFGLTLLATFILPFAFGLSFLIPISPLFLLIAGIATAYSIVRHRLLDIRLVVARAVAYIFLLVIFGAFYSIVLFSLTRYFFDDSDLPIIVYVVLALFAAFTFQPFKNLLEKATTKIFFKNQYDSNDLLFNLTKILATTLDLDQLARGALNELLSVMHITRGAFLIMGKDLLYPPVYIGSDHAPDYDFARVGQLCNFKKLVVFDEEQLEAVKEFMRDKNISVILPLFVGSENEGILVLGEKKSGEIYSNQDIDVLEIFGPEISVAVQNSKAYEEIRQFNITLTREIEKATHDLKIANEKLKELDKLKDDFVSVASHELRTPMTAIKSYLWMALNKKKGELSDDMKRYLDRSYISVERLISLVNDMLNISRIEGGRIALSLSEVDLVSLAQEVKDEVLAKASEKKVKVEIKESKIPKALADRDKIHEVLLNLVGNSLKFTPEGGKITVSFSQKPSSIITSIADTGRGIDKEDMPRLFAKFGRLDNSYVSVAESSGTGLGLYISKSLVNLHKGSIEVASEGVGKGATFTFSLPKAGGDLALQLATDAPGETEGAKELEKTSINI